MKIVTLTSVQHTQAVALKSAVNTAQASLLAARKALGAYLVAAAGAPKNSRVNLTDDGTAIVIG